MVNLKGEVIAKCQRNGFGTPEFRVQAKGEKHKPEFLCEVILNKELLGSGKASTKKKAEHIAAEAALEWLERTNFNDYQNDLEDEQADIEDTEFDGPWPIFPELLAESLRVANSRVKSSSYGENAIDDIQTLSLRLYKGVLRDLGDIVEEED